jgi:hypothetical protein
MAGIGAPSRTNWTRVNKALTVCSALVLVGAVEVFLFEVVWTHGVYGSRMAWLLGVTLPLVAITAGLALAATKYGTTASRGQAEGAQHPAGPRSRSGGRDPRCASRAIGVVSLILIGVPVAFAGLLLATYGLIFVSHWIR